jgi:hypothetical protein
MGCSSQPIFSKSVVFRYTLDITVTANRWKHKRYQAFSLEGAALAHAQSRLKRRRYSEIIGYW